MVKLALALALLGGCFEDRYRCTSDAQCDLGSSGRCEVDGYCSEHDTACATQRSYVHAGELTATCFDDRAVPRNACASGQPPARPEGCFATVCDLVPACCSVGWLDACVQLAQEVCPDLRCDTRLTVTALRGQVTERYEVTWAGTSWSSTAHPDAGLLAWVGPEPGQVSPRIASIVGGKLLIGDASLDAPVDRTYTSVSTADVDRDGRDTVIATYQTETKSIVEISAVATRSARTTAVLAAGSLVWGDDDRDGFVDPIVRGGGNYYLYPNDFSLPIRANVTGGNTPGAPPLRNIESIDVNGDHLLDVVAFGTSLRIHTAAQPTNVAQFDLDCDPPSVDKPCANTQSEPDVERASFGGAALPTGQGPSLVATVYPGRKLYRLSFATGTPSASPLPFPGDSCACTTKCDAQACPGPQCTCTYDCSACTPVLAVAARDLDGNHELDLIAIDARLQLYTALAPAYAFGAPTPIASPTANFVSVDLTVSGAPIP
jgi:hypothetical protein